jgi:hypothetical protein
MVWWVPSGPQFTSVENFFGGYPLETAAFGWKYRLAVLAIKA